MGAAIRSRLQRAGFVGNRFREEQRERIANAFDAAQFAGIDPEQEREASRGLRAFDPAGALEGGLQQQLVAPDVELAEGDAFFSQPGVQLAQELLSIPEFQGQGAQLLSQLVGERGAEARAVTQFERGAPVREQQEELRAEQINNARLSGQLSQGQIEDAARARSRAEQFAAIGITPPGPGQKVFTNPAGRIVVGPNDNNERLITAKQTLRKSNQQIASIDEMIRLIEELGGAEATNLDPAVLEIRVRELFSVFPAFAKAAELGTLQEADQEAIRRAAGGIDEFTNFLRSPEDNSRSLRTLNEELIKTRDGFIADRPTFDFGDLNADTIRRDAERSAPTGSQPLSALQLDSVSPEDRALIEATRGRGGLRGIESGAENLGDFGELIPTTPGSARSLNPFVLVPNVVSEISQAARPLLTNAFEGAAEFGANQRAAELEFLEQQLATESNPTRKREIENAIARIRAFEREGGLFALPR